MKIKKIVLLMTCFIFVFSLVGCGKSKNKKEQITVEQQQVLDKEKEEKAAKNKKPTPIRQLVNLNEENGKLVFLNSLAENGSSLLETTKSLNGNTYYLSSPTVPIGQIEFPERIGNSFIKVTTEFNEEGVESEREIQFQIDNKGNTPINLEAPENIVFEKIYGVNLKDINGIYKEHLRTYLSKKSNKKQVYTSSIEINNIWMVTGKTTFYEYDTYGKKIKETFQVSIRKQENLIKNRYHEFYNNLIKSNYDLNYLNDDNYVLNREFGEYTIKYNVLPNMLTYTVEGYENAFNDNWEKNIQEIKAIDIYNDIDFRQVSFHVKNVLNKFRDVPLKLDEKQIYSSVKRIDENTYSTTFKLYDRNEVAKYIVEVMCHVEDNENNNNSLEIRYMPLFLKERGK